MTGNLYWLFVFGTVLAFLRTRHSVVAVQRKPPLVYIDPQRELDMKRWSHMGNQPVAPINGNRERVPDLQVMHLDKLLD
jgi:hypothetical protein